MFKTNRCLDRPMYASSSNYQYMASDTMPNEYPQAVPSQDAGMMSGANMECPGQPIYECPTERVCNREFIHNVEHIVPIHTRIINHHIYRHTYRPCYTCCEENVCCNVYEGCPNRF